MFNSLKLILQITRCCQGCPTALLPTQRNVCVYAEHRSKINGAPNCGRRHLARAVILLFYDLAESPIWLGPTSIGRSGLADASHSVADGQSLDPMVESYHRPLATGR
jgi:hypothetical protein